MPAGRNGGFYQHPHAAVESESNAVAEDSRPFAAGVIATPKPAGKGRVEKKFASKKSERSEFSSKNLKKADTQKDSERSERPDKLAKPVGGRDEGRIEGPGTSQSGRVEIHGTRSAGRNGGRGRGRGRGTPAMPDPTSKITAAPKTAGPQVLVSKPDDTSAGRSGGLGRGGRGSSRGGRGGRGRGFDNRGPPAIPREVV